ncbi:hypothetical protein TWF730_007795 [Orbilia blumenaviensis]|uniref:Uncharacterized protein n=1 Tax=Orbilia blumenaviensis TaxID=1796055 RepID=A0AAV9VC42_9PEZI
MDIYPFLDWIRYMVVRLFITLGLLCILPIFILFLLEPLVYILRFVEDCLPSSISSKKPVRQTSMSIANLSSITSETNPGSKNGVKRREEVLGQDASKQAAAEG